VKRVPAILLVVIIAGFLAGLWHLVHLRFQAGDIYPEYSTLRADPLGTKAFHEGLDRLLEVRRNFKSRLDPVEGKGTTLFLLGVAGAEVRFSPEDLKDLENFAASGGRVVISFLPRFEESLFHRLDQEATARKTNDVTKTSPPSSKTDKKKKPPVLKPQPDEDELPAGMRPVSMAERWKFEVKRGLAVKDENGVYKPFVAQRKTGATLPESLEWHTAVSFEKPDRAWRAIYVRERDRVLVMERAWGSGSLVLLSDSYCVSNEALRWHRHADLLAWLVGPNPRVIFDETHLGVQEDPGIATLARQYRLHGLFLALLVLAGLFIWKSAAVFMPPPERELALERGEQVLGRESHAGFVNLLRRNIRAQDLPGVCFSEWKKSCARGLSATKLEQIQAVIEAENAQPARSRNPVVAYGQCCQILARRKPGLSMAKSQT
jgi:hypothetical protein